MASEIPTAPAAPPPDPNAPPNDSDPATARIFVLSVAVIVTVFAAPAVTPLPAARFLRIDAEMVLVTALPEPEPAPDPPNPPLPVLTATATPKVNAAMDEVDLAVTSTPPPEETRA